MKPEKKQRKKTGWIWFLLLLGLMIFLVSGMGLMRSCKKGNPQQANENWQSSSSGSSDMDSRNLTSYDSQRALNPIEKKPEIDFQKLETDKALDELMAERKEKLGVADSLDMIVQEDEQFIVGARKISMKDVLKKIEAQKGNVYEETIDPAEQITPDQSREYGIYVVRPNDNIWNIHFQLLKDYFSARNILLAPSADEPAADGTSSGIGKILKFSETLVSIYHVQEKKIVKDINIIEPLSKILIYNMSEIFSLLEGLDYQNVSRIEFDGTNIWIPAETNE